MFSFAGKQNSSTAASGEADDHPSPSNMSSEHDCSSCEEEEGEGIKDDEQEHIDDDEENENETSDDQESSGEDEFEISAEEEEESIDIAPLNLQTDPTLIKIRQLIIRTRKLITLIRRTLLLVEYVRQEKEKKNYQEM